MTTPPAPLLNHVIQKIPRDKQVSQVSPKFYFVEEAGQDLRSVLEQNPLFAPRRSTMHVRLHAKIYQSMYRTPVFDHHKDDLFLADLGYIGCAHCLVPYRDLTKSQKHLNQSISFIRSPIKAMFCSF